MPTTSALLRSSQAARKKIQAQQDAVVAYNWENSAQTYEDFKQYSEYLQNRAEKTTDPSAKLTLTGKIRSASRSYTSNEIQRQSIDILNGNGTLQDKQNKVLELAQKAADAGDANLLQNLTQQYSQLDVQIQNEAETQAKAQQALAERMVRENVKSVKQLIDRQKQDLTEVGKIYQQVGAEGFNQALKDPEVKKAILETNPQLKELFNKNGQIGFWDIANGVVANIRQSYEQAAGSLPPDEAEQFLKEIEKIDSGEAKFKIPGVGSVTANDLQNQMDAVRAGGTYFYQGPDNTMEKGDLTNYTWAKDENGKYRLVKQYSQKDTGTGFGTAQFGQDQRTGDNLANSLVYRRDEKGNYLNEQGKIVGQAGKNGEILDSKGKKITDEAVLNKIRQASTTDYKTLLENNGFRVGSTSDGGIRVIPTDQVKSRFAELGITDGAPLNAVVDPQGNLRFIKKKPDGTDELFQVGFDDKGKAYTQKLQEGGQGAVSAQDYFEMRQATKMFGGTTPFAGLNAGRASLTNTSELIARGENFRYGKLNDMEQRKKLLAELQPAPLQLNIPQKVANAIATPVASAVRSASQKITSTPGMAAAISSQAAAVKALQQPAKYGVLQDPIRKAAVIKDVSSKSNPGNRNFAQKLAGFFGF